MAGPFAVLLSLEKRIRSNSEFAPCSIPGCRKRREILLWRLSLRRFQQHFLSDLADDVARQDMALLDSWRLVGRNANHPFLQFFHFSPDPPHPDPLNRSPFFS